MNNRFHFKVDAHCHTHMDLNTLSEWYNTTDRLICRETQSTEILISSLLNHCCKNTFIFYTYIYVDIYIYFFFFTEKNHYHSQVDTTLTNAKDSLRVNRVATSHTSTCNSKVINPVDVLNEYIFYDLLPAAVY